MLKGLVQTGGTGLVLGTVSDEDLRALVASAAPEKVFLVGTASRGKGDPAAVTRAEPGALEACLTSLGHRLDWACVAAGASSLAAAIKALEALLPHLSASANVFVATDVDRAPQLSGFVVSARSRLDAKAFLHQLRRPFPTRHRLFSYWQNPLGITKRPAYLDLCAETVARHLAPSIEHVELDERTIRDFLPTVREDVARLPTLAHRADYYRARLVHDHGGFWIDRDCILTTSLEACLADLEASRSDFIGVGRPGPRPSIGFFGGLAESCLLRRYIARMDALLDGSTGKQLRWTALGYDLLWPLTVTYPFHQYELGRAVLVSPGEPDRFFERGEAASFKEMNALARCLLIFLYNAQFPAWFKAMSTREILSSDMLVSHLFRVALEP